MRKKKGKGRKRKDKRGQEWGTKKRKGKWERREDKGGIRMGNMKGDSGRGRVGKGNGEEKGMEKVTWFPSLPRDNDTAMSLAEVIVT